MEESIFHPTDIFYVHFLVFTGVILDFFYVHDFDFHGCKLSDVFASKCGFSPARFHYFSVFFTGSQIAFTHKKNKH